MNIKIDTQNKTVTVLEEVTIINLTNELQILLGDDYYKYKIIPSPIEYHPYIQPIIDYPTIYRHDTSPSHIPTIT